MSYNGPPGQGPPHNTPQQQQQAQQQQQQQQAQQQHQQAHQQQQAQQQQLHHPQHHPHPQHQHPQYMYYPPGHAGGHPSHGPPPHQPQQPQQQQQHGPPQAHGPPPQQAHPQSHGPPPQQQHQAPPPPQQQQQPSSIPPLAQAHVCICPNVTRVPRPRNAFILYRQHHHSIVVAENPGKSNPEISKIIGEQWRSLAQTEKDFWVQLSDEEKRSHLERFPDYRYQPRRNPKKNGGETNSGVCPVCRGITSAGAGAGNTYSPRHSSGGSSGSVGSIGSMGGSIGGNSSGSFSSISSSHSSFDASSGMPYPPPPPPPQSALFHPHYPHPAARYSYPTSVEHVAAQTRHNSAPETFSALPRIVPRDELEMEGRERAASHSQAHQGSVAGPSGPPNTSAPTSAGSSVSQPSGKHIKFENTTPKLSSQPLQYSPAFHSPLSLNSLTHRTRLPPTHALIEEDHATKRRRTSSYHDPLAPHHLPQQQRRSVRYKSAIAIASGRISPLVSEEGGPMSMREKADALSMLCEPLPGQLSERSRIVAIEGGGEWGRKVVESVREKLSSAVGSKSPDSGKTESATKGKETEATDKSGTKTEPQTEVKAPNTPTINTPSDSKYSFVTLHNIAGASDVSAASTASSTTPANSLACIINQKPDFITDGFASAMWSITCLHQLVSNYFHSAQNRSAQPGVVLLHGYLVTIADKFVQEHLMRQSHTSTYSEEHESEAMERWKRDTSAIPEESESGSPASVAGGAGRSPSVAIAPHAGGEHDHEFNSATTRDQTRDSVSHDPVHNAHPHITSHPHHETRVAELAHESRGSVSRDHPHPPHGSVSHDPLMSRASVSESVSSAAASSYLEEWMSSANLLRGLPAPDILIYLQAEGSELESSAVELRGQGKLVVVRGDDSIFEKVVDKIVHIIEAL
ncbi:Repressor of filamentous growth 1 [Yarrowia sp. C11]|nr:Repressor of filamentous growth 1 [Yarrowia sp. E02]KAG5371560.1 Repressor of filamentous growth 1 [Yarrowia sp. C11]